MTKWVGLFDFQSRAPEIIMSLGTEDFHPHGVLDVESARLAAQSCEQQVKKSTLKRITAFEEARDRYWDVEKSEPQHVNLQMKEAYNVACKITVGQHSGTCICCVR